MSGLSNSAAQPSTSSTAPSARTGRFRRLGRLRVWGLPLCAAALIGGAWLAYGSWTDYREERFKTGCEAAEKSADWLALESLAREWVEHHPDNGTAWLYLAEAFQEQGDLDRAVRALARVPNDDPKAVPALLIRADLLLKALNRPLESIETCRRVLTIDPLQPEARRRLIYFYAMTLQRDRMVRLIRESVELRREPPEAYIYLAVAPSLRFSDGYSVVSRWLERHPDHEDFLVARAYYLSTASSDRAIQEVGAPESEPMDRCLERFPDNLEVLAFHLEKRARDGDLPGMAELLSHLPREAEQDSRFWRLKGLYHLERNEIDPAEAALLKAIGVNPYDWRSRHQLARVFRRQNRIEEAESASRLALAGKELARSLMGIKNPAEISGEMLLRIANHADQCGDGLVARGIRGRLVQ